DGLEREMRFWLERLARFTGVEQVGLWECGPSGSDFGCDFEYVNRGLEAAGFTQGVDRFPWLHEQYRHERIVAWRNAPEDIPAEADDERAEALRTGVRSMLGIPLGAPGRSVLVLTSYTGHMAWPRSTIRRLRLVGEILMSAVLRRRTERALQSSEARGRALLET